MHLMSSIAVIIYSFTFNSFILSYLHIVRSYHCGRALPAEGV